VSVCARAVKEKWRAINTKLDTQILYGRNSVCIDLEVKRSRSWDYEVCCWCGHACQYDSL